MRIPGSRLRLPVPHRNLPWPRRCLQKLLNVPGDRSGQVLRHHGRYDILGASSWWRYYWSVERTSLLVAR